MLFRQLFDRESCTYTYLVGDGAAGVAALIDPVREHVARDLDLVRELGVTLTHIFDTHVHADHITGAGELRKRTGAKGHVARDGGAPCADVLLDDGDVVHVGAIEIRVMATPGHTRDCLSLLVGDRVFTGDALFVRGCGRTDFQNGDAGTLFDSVMTKLFVLPEETRVYPGHDYRGMTVSTIGEEKRHNPRLGGGVARDAFIATMASLGLPPPAKIAEALPANLACGNVD
jgi:sulfur dioxygenase